jgi:hypothetical protein
VSGIFQEEEKWSVRLGYGGFEFREGVNGNERRKKVVNAWGFCGNLRKENGKARPGGPRYVADFI